MTDDENNTSGQVQFTESHIPALETGDYIITVEQQVEIAKDVNHPDPVKQTFKLKQQIQTFSVLGPRFTLDPQEIQAAFPPPGSLGEHSNVLPHIILKRSTLPWERSANGEENVTWLALLLFDEGDIPNKIDDTDEIKARNGALFDQIKTPNSWMLNEVQAATTVDLPKSSETSSVAKTTYTVHFPKLGPESGDHPEDAMAVIDVPKSLLSQILPSTEELKLLAHVRQTADTEGNPQEDEVAVVICNRLPKQGGMSLVHLVSVEGRYNTTGFNFPEETKDDELIRLVSLYSWRFACVSEKQTFKNLLLQLNHPTLFNISATNNVDELAKMTIPAQMMDAFQQSEHPVGTLPKVTDYGQWKISTGNTYYIVGQKLAVYDFAGRTIFTLDDASKPSNPVSQKDDEPGIRASFLKNKYPLDKNISIKAVSDHWWIEADESNQKYVVSKEENTLYVHHLDLDSSSTLRLPDLKSKDEKANELAKPYLAMGCVPLPHDMRQGNTSVSWYHGPFVPGDRNEDEIKLPIMSADEIIRYSPAVGMFDVSYSAAWELGRLLTLQNKRVSLDLFNWKRGHAQSLKDAEGQLDHLPFNTQTALDLPDGVRAWFEDMALLKGLPFNYLVPDERMLPTESIRFFNVDELWVECMLDGAFSIGRVLAKDHERDGDLSQHLPGEKHLSGFLLRSDVVAGWPGLLVDGYGDTDANTALHLMRMDCLSKNVLLCLFYGIIQAIDIHLKPETLHFGISEGGTEGNWCKMPRDKMGNEIVGALPISIPFRSYQNVIDVKTLANLLQRDSTSAEFALQMIEGVEKVRFIKKMTEKDM